MQFPYHVPLSTLLYVMFILFGPLLALQVGELQNPECTWSSAFLYYDISARITPYLVHRWVLRNLGKWDRCRILRGR